LNFTFAETGRLFSEQSDLNNAGIFSKGNEKKTSINSFFPIVSFTIASSFAHHFREVNGIAENRE